MGSCFARTLKGAWMDALCDDGRGTRVWSGLNLGMYLLAPSLQDPDANKVFQTSTSRTGTVPLAATTRQPGRFRAVRDNVVHG